MITVTPELLAAVVGRPFGGLRQSQRDMVSAVAPVIAAHQAELGLDAPLRLAHFLAQIGHESDDWSTTTEYASGIAYEGRRDLGNTVRGDGVRYRGRGLVQITGRGNYRAFSAWMRRRDPRAPDFEADPEQAAASPWSTLSALWFWSVHDLNRLAALDDLVAVTRVVNGGRNGLPHRRQLLAAAKAAIAARLAETTPADPVRPVLRRGSEGESVGLLQRALVAAGYPITIDEDFGPATGLAVRTFQARTGLAADGVVGRATWRALAPYLET